MDLKSSLRRGFTVSSAVAAFVWLLWTLCLEHFTLSFTVFAVSSFTHVFLRQAAFVRLVTPLSLVLLVL